MQHPFDALAPEYTSLLARMQIARVAEVDYVVRERKAHDGTPTNLIALIDAGHYDQPYSVTAVPKIVEAASFEREASSNFRLSPAQGDPWDRPSTHVPRGLVFPNWNAAAIKAYQIDGLDKIGAANWSWPRGCYEEEAFNGFGPRNHGKHTGYLWAGTNIYTGGKYVADDVWDPNAQDEQLGVIPMMYRIVQLRPDLALPIAFPKSPATGSPPIAPLPPMPPPVGLRDAADLQRALNSLGADPQLTVDDSYGRETKHAVIAFQRAAGLEADGIAGPETWLAIIAKLKQSARTS